ncbi:MAG: hypothetical protein A2725_01600 [Candidatus Magasanikbacteria bacterium RIFCSPHIGHO2_01_FULL_33_34]|uniref:Dihydroorotate dehydrogenase catalytic domain-containing protein n=1 Tax=Candidatus Magasanikbacteria bacterium RIFCSPHIGHO2_01_FULL_33_34 TaxID=1798671 RepID=A0A1F6LJC2_9BACT|nr:MAG: hypothetical protein A2725_01600 [Candidatus Magasanikbacteria bacterium RIFCSPHIGHO2_01_FULL_33_34]OGH65507.1 MAG: hypothetical protein A3B83_01355 [Candidatus Magasanikbacteria bacterium RIFCSPHIGHO2_02_FULL_33_17]OGH76217.1 MAG: hypothetical protein A3A89_02175 [Candidatus Magasanikbacteria bacterium RIFCSPLOWO2_01_FULL_33_34]OGH81624.1 MAG: hypothetical protein A3F93_03570 [Candidatus Magasanikbacteria bacterium RIFCSPLOWO2_12_FULL_34_7]
MINTPFYDPTKSYEENYSDGPFGAFADNEIYQNQGEPNYDYHNHKVYSPFGIPAGPIINSNFAKSAFEKGFDLVVYKTVRTGIFPCHPHPNIMAIHIDKITPEIMAGKITADTNYTEPLTITNSFGVPSKDPDEWQIDIKKAISYAKTGQMLIAGFMGTVKENQTQEEFIKDYALAARLTKETGAKVLEANLSCPNIGNEGLVCYNIDITHKVCKAIRDEIGNTPLAIKLGYFNNDNELKKIAEIAHNYVDEVIAINTLPSTIVDKYGNQALKGQNRVKSGICGAGIKWAGLDMVKRLKKIRDENNYKFSITGVGGVMNKEDFKEYQNIGAEIVMSATGAMWDPYLAQKIKSI